MLGCRNNGCGFRIPALHFADDTSDPVRQVIAAGGEVQQEAADLAD
jgi:hypothetical protein